MLGVSKVRKGCELSGSAVAVDSEKSKFYCGSVRANQQLRRGLDSSNFYEKRQHSAIIIN
jgi:hypothetical protein